MIKDQHVDHNLLPLISRNGSRKPESNFERVQGHWKNKNYREPVTFSGAARSHMNHSTTYKPNYFDAGKFRTFDESNGFISMASRSHASKQPSPLYMTPVNKKTVFTKFEYAE